MRIWVGNGGLFSYSTSFILSASKILPSITRLTYGKLLTRKSSLFISPFASVTSSLVVTALSTCTKFFFTDKYSDLHTKLLWQGPYVGHPLLWFPRFFYKKKMFFPLKILSRPFNKFHLILVPKQIRF
jgi:hypothetical protein